MEDYTIHKRGRPIGYELSEDSKDKIRRSREGKSHSKETRNKISKSLIRYFRKKDPISSSIEMEYRYFPKEARAWLHDHSDDIDADDTIITDKRIVYLNQLEVCYGHDIEDFCHFMTPEFLLLLKEELNGVGHTEELKEFLSLLS